MSNRLLRTSIAMVMLVALSACSPFGGGDKAPQLEMTSVKGQAVSMPPKGKVTLVNFWATSCGTCVKEMPQLVATYNKYREKGYETVAVAMSYDPPNYVLNYAEKNQLPFPVTLDVQGKAAEAYGGVMVTPTTYLIDRRGNIVQRFIGEPDMAELHKLIEAKLAEQA
ncbi:peroxiredoxin [Chitinivorax tropicus]|uniref:Peroxiredoxin n=1 Tax=Chitinivorax tropicus TaxID=714531 RepID=A0A840MKG8_9PROT|nr:TlpA disulfide reductase family protein [Chitinivorax tropicus]MBB5017202.1 peroxiredoxin [Chitinivorax tropicus]